MTHTRDNRSKEKEAGAKDDDDHQEKISYAKVVILGASGVGKTSIIKVFSKTEYSQRLLSVQLCLIPSLLVQLTKTF